MSTTTICTKIIESAQALPNKIVLSLIGKEGQLNISFADMLSQIRNVAYQLSLNGIERGDRVTILGENDPNWVIAYLSTLFLGATAVPIDLASSIETLISFINNSQSKIIFISPNLISKFQEVSKFLNRPIKVVLLYSTPQVKDLPCLEEWASSQAPTEFSIPLPAKSEDVAVLVYTSGTTGQPKAVPLTHANIFAEADSLQRVMNFSENEVILGLLPLFHVYSQVAVLWIVPMIGARVVFISELTSNEIARGLQEGEITALIGVPRLWYLFHKKIFDQVNSQPSYLRWLFKAMLSANGLLRDLFRVNVGKLFFGRVHKFFGNKLRLAVSAGARFDPNIASDFHRLGFTLLQGYGLSETSGAMTVTRFEDNKVGSVGKPLPNVEVKIGLVDKDGIGEVIVRGPIVMQGYYNNPEANRNAFTSDGWFRTGDLGKFDSSGNLYILGRSKDIFKLPSGKNIFPEDIESHYSHSPLVSEICVLGVKDEASQFKDAEKLCAVVVPDFQYLKAHHIANAREAIRFELDNLGRDLPEYQRVHDYILRTKTLPRTTTNKVRRLELQKQLEMDSSTAKEGRKAIVWDFTQADLGVIQSLVGKAVSNAVQHQVGDTKTIHPQMNLELDLGLDSLARAECVASLEKSLNISLPSEDVASTLTVGELISLVNTKLVLPKQACLDNQIFSSVGRTELENQNWKQILNNSKDVVETKGLLKNKPILATFAYIVLKILLLIEKVLFRVEISGLENLSKLQRPFLICPNHQSFIDAFLVCSTYPYKILTNIFHVGTSDIFTGKFFGQLAELFNIVPIDPDAKLLSAMQVSARGLQAGKILNVYPEGQRSFDGKLGEFKKGAAILAIELDLPIIPVAIEGSYKVLPRKGKWIHVSKVKICFGEPLFPNQVITKTANQEERYENMTSALKSKIRQMLDQLHLKDC